MDHVDPLETWKAMEQLVDEGLVKNIGVSNHEIDDLKNILDGKPIKPIATNQIEVHPYVSRMRVAPPSQSLPDLSSTGKRTHSPPPP